MISDASISSGARPRESRNFDGSSGWRALTWPKASQTFSAERMRFATTSSSVSVFKSGMTPPSIAFPFAATILDRRSLAQKWDRLVDQPDTIKTLDEARALESAGSAAEATDLTS